MTRRQGSLQIRRLGVVSVPVSVPITSVDVPEVRRMEPKRWAVVVLPLVPVIPTTDMCRDGLPNTSLAKAPISERTSSTMI